MEVFKHFTFILKPPVLLPDRQSPWRRVHGIKAVPSETEDELQGENNHCFSGNIDIVQLKDKVSSVSHHLIHWWYF